MDDSLLMLVAQMRRIAPHFFQLSHGVARLKDRRVKSGIIFVIQNGLRWRAALSGYGPHKMIYNWFARWSRLGVFNKICGERAGKAGKSSRLMIDATHLKAHRIAANLLKRSWLLTDTMNQKSSLQKVPQSVSGGADGEQVS